jgi:hypothetical protein
VAVDLVHVILKSWFRGAVVSRGWWKLVEAA